MLSVRGTMGLKVRHGEIPIRRGDVSATRLTCFFHKGPKDGPARDESAIPLLSMDEMADDKLRSEPPRLVADDGNESETSSLLGILVEKKPPWWSYIWVSVFEISLS